MHFVLLSLLGHLLLAGLFWMPWDLFHRTTITAQPIIPLELVDISEVTTVPPHVPEPLQKKVSSPAPTPSQEELEPVDVRAAASVPEPPKPASPQPTPSEPQAAEEGIAPPQKTKPKDPPQKNEETKEDKKKKKKKEEDFLENIVKDLDPEKKKKTPTKKEDEKKSKKKTSKTKDPLDDIEKDLQESQDSKTSQEGAKTPPLQGIPGDKLSLSEMDAIRSQVASCWNVPAGAMDAGSLKVDVRVHMRSDGTVQSVDVISAHQMRQDPLFRAASESAVRALLNPKCNPLKLPLNKYDSWKTFTMSFDPKEMF